MCQPTENYTKMFTMCYYTYSILSNIVMTLYHQVAALLAPPERTLYVVKRFSVKTIQLFLRQISTLG